jgi:hypothetical protein
MKVKQLIEILTALNPDAAVHIDIDDYPTVDGAYSPEDYSGDEEDRPPTDAVLLEISYPRN